MRSDILLSLDRPILALAVFRPIAAPVRGERLTQAGTDSLAVQGAYSNVVLLSCVESLVLTTLHAPKPASELGEHPLSASLSR